MTRAEFCAALRTALAGMPEAAIADVVSDYETHFAEGIAAGRSEEDIAQALGEPARLARELRTEAGLQRWEQKRTPGNAVAAVFALIGLGAIDIIVLVPLLVTFIGVLIGAFFWTLGIFAGGVAATAFGPLIPEMPGGPFTAILGGIGMIAAATFGAAILTMITAGLVNAIVWYARLHYRALKLANASS